MPNKDLLRATLAHIEAHPEDWHQEDYRCETGMCFAGWAAQLAGGTWLTDADAAWGDMLVAEDDDDPEHLYAYESGTKAVTAGRRAQRILGLTWQQSERLFAGGNSLANLRHLVAELCEEATDDEH